MKQLIIVAIIVFIIALSAGGAWIKELLKKQKDSEKLDYELEDIDFPSLSGNELAQILDGKKTKIPLKVTENIKNPTGSSFNISNMTLKLSTLSGDTILNQTKPLEKPLIIKPNSSDNDLELAFELSSDAVAKLVKSVGGVIQAGINKLNTGEFGFAIRLTGNLLSEGFNVELDEILNF